MSWRLRLSVETILRLTPAVLGSTVFSIAGLCAAHACLDDQALLAAREAIGSSLQTLGSVHAASSSRATARPAAPSCSTTPVVIADRLRWAVCGSARRETLSSS